MKALRVPRMYKCIGLCDADLLDNGTRHPNLVLMKIAGFLFDNHILFELILDPKANLERYEHVFLSRVFTAHPINQGENSLILYKICTFAP